jgi:hypothetical protein
LGPGEIFANDNCHISGWVSKPEPAWPKPDLDAINHIVSAGGSLYDLWERSPIRFDGSSTHAEEIIDILLPGNPLLCVAKSNAFFATRRREVWRGTLSNLPLMVANPMAAISGQTQDGHWSQHTKEVTARRVYQIVEFDFSELDKTGHQTVWAPLIRKWKEFDISILDACAALILHLAGQSPTLTVVCFSGGKSLHAWFRVLELGSGQQRKFMGCAVGFGADRATWNKAQLVRIPDGLRQNGVRQICYYLDPREAVKL